jgi:predicted Fe-Mo cluster-binding NifX family protein
MITAIALNGTTAESKIDRHFGKCTAFLLLSEDTGKWEIIPNPAASQTGCKGEIIVDVLLSHNTGRVIAGDFGANVQQLMNQHAIQMIIHPDESVTAADLIKLLSIKRK